MTDHRLVWNKGFQWNITGEQSIQGQEWLKRREVLKLMNETDRATFEDFDHFTFVGFHIKDISTPYFKRLNVRPVYRVHAKSGKWFDYASAPWQSGAYDNGGHPSFKLLSRGTK